MSDHNLPEPSRAAARLIRPTRTMLLTIVLLFVLLGTLYLWRGWRASQAQAWQPQAVPVAAMVVQSRDIPAALEAVGSLRAVREVTLSPEIAGRVSAIHFEAGQPVGAGALLVQLFDGPERADHRAAQAKAAFAGIQVARSQELAPTGAEPRETLEQRRADRDQAAAAVQQIDARLVQKQVRAPFAGILGIRQVNLGQYLNPGDAVATLTALDSLFVDFALPQQELSRLKPGATVIVTSDAWPGRRFTAKVNAIEPKISADTRNVSVQALLGNGDRALRPGMYVTAALELPVQQGALLVPATAIQTSAQGDSIIVIRGSNARVGGKAEIVPVQTGRRVGNDVVVTRGLRAGDVIVTEGQLRVQPGAEVKVAAPTIKGGR
ncbi:MAG: efflux RND transporter periplasmic adaptor subunit [Pseudomonadota bacterium]|jgi:membrane fusion protein, multidrug efflux system|uniref:efflux RND transporter periplasmic adaptor subunit n=1 Tax=Sphingobium yanoikuyae TaxID=13690 RepID=UPI0013785F52|nr:efflux RND transporter periplasmic adaptor subunit [Sphingobium yanoikuyae]NBB38345.1 efflux RND transporter periplasmic adaptor subunit [Sphingobium yanoikuyae]